MKYLTVALALLFTVSTASADTVKSYDFASNKNGFACTLTMFGSEGGKLNIRISKVESGWITMVSVSDRAEKFRSLYGSDGVLDRTLASTSLSMLIIDTTTFLLDRALVTDLTIDQVDSETGAIMHIPDDEATKALVLASKGDLVAMPLVIALDGASAALSEFRSCGMAAMAIQG